ncbi:ABC transporter substrate-binding protein [Streptomyces sp. CBMA29]|uniref:ABC transporter substrate-binding protein n=1 Tax=Streptomyces sp. CBMA29 TaxID=1896314 RepID=UPI0016618C7B|nr:ABC transporter substrate-binding protein [Streptomyces sp. CBMA29]MBD0740324.1 hypothetical protein [Streptomyces sp. CBMA29]
MTIGSNGLISVPAPPPRRSRPWIRSGLAVLVAAALAVGGLFAYRAATDTSCGAGVSRQGTPAQCVGVTDGSYAFAPELVEIEGMIRKENRTVVASGNYVSVAYMLPMTLGPTDTGTIEAVREELEGAYAEQHSANTLPRLKGQNGIRLLLANSGSRSEQWQGVTRQLVGMVDSERLVAVLGFGQSRATTKQAIQELANAHRIPAIGATVTADDLTDATTAPDFFRISPRNSDEGQAAAHYLAQRTPRGKVLVVTDTDDGDSYNVSLYNGFVSAAKAEKLQLSDATLNYRSGSAQTGFDFSNMLNSVCQAHASAVYFAGRGKDLDTFVSALANRQCRTAQGVITVVSGDDTSSMRPDQEFRHALQTGGVTLLFTALTAPNEWEKEKGDDYSVERQAYAEFHKAVVTVFRDATDSMFQDGHMIMAYDATFTAVKAIRFAEGHDGTDPVTTNTVGQQLVSLQSTNAVQGASGPIDLQRNRNPLNKPMALLSVTGKGDYSFNQVIWPAGRPWSAL